MTRSSLTHPGRAAIATAGLAIAMSLAALTGSAAAQYTIDPPGPLPEPILQPIVTPCSQIASFAPASARPGQDIDIYIKPPSGRVFLPYTVTGVQFANGVPATSFSNPAAHHVRAKVPVGSSTGPVRVTCRSPITGGTWSITSATAFTPISFGNTLNPNPVTVIVGNSANVTATLSHPAPQPITLTLAPQSNALSVNGLARGASGTVTIPTGQQSASFSVGAHAAGAGTSVVVTGPNVVTSTLAVTVPTPSFSLSNPPDAKVHWGDSASYSVQVSSENGFAGTVTLSASNLPFGATAAPVSVSVPAGGSANATFNVATAQAATDLGPGSFTLRGASPGAADRTRTPDLRVLPDLGDFAGLTWRTTSNTCGSIEAEVIGSNITFDGPNFIQTQAHTHLRYAWTPGCRGAVVLGTSVGQNGGWPVSIYNFGFDNAIARAPGSHQNLGAAAWNTDHFKVSPDSSYLVGVAQGTSFYAHLYNMLDLAERGAMDSYSVAETLTAVSIVENTVNNVVDTRVHGQPSGSSDPLNWTLP